MTVGFASLVRDKVLKNIFYTRDINSHRSMFHHNNDVIPQVCDAKVFFFVQQQAFFYCFNNKKYFKTYEFKTKYLYKIIITHKLHISFSIDICDIIK